LWFYLNLLTQLTLICLEPEIMKAIVALVFAALLAAATASPSRHAASLVTCDYHPGCCINIQQPPILPLLTRRRELLSTARAQQVAIGTQTATATVAARMENGMATAATRGAATGPGAITAGISEAEGQIVRCVAGPADSAVCITLAPRDRASFCSNVPPSAQYNCQEQANFGKCDEPWIFVGAYCLDACNRCGEECVDVPPEDGSCDPAKCDSEAYTTEPVCLRSCGRCSTVE
jgi:hypothetical protein